MQKQTTNIVVGVCVAMITDNTAITNALIMKDDIDISAKTNIMMMTMVMVASSHITHTHKTHLNLLLLIRLNKCISI